MSKSVRIYPKLMVTGLPWSTFGKAPSVLRVYSPLARSTFDQTGVYSRGVMTLTRARIERFRTDLNDLKKMIRNFEIKYGLNRREFMILIDRLKNMEI